MIRNSFYKSGFVFSVTSLMFLYFSCSKDVIVKDIKGKNIVVNSPTNNLTTTTNQITFWWEELEGAEKYNLQIVKPSFTALTKLVIDTNLFSNKMNVILVPGSYQWRIKAINGGGTTEYQTYNFKVDTTSSLSGQLISTNFPINNFMTNKNKVNFSWNALNSALQYQVVISSANGGVVKDTLTALSNYSFSFPQLSTTYTWKVRGLNNTSISLYTLPLSIHFDFTAPAVSTPTAPLGTSALPSILSPTNSLAWLRTGSPDARYDSIFVATDSLFVNTVSRTKTYQTSIKINELNTSPSSNGSYYWWRLRSIDSVGNSSSSSNHYKFKLNP
jgi:hypothetical protein